MQSTGRELKRCYHERSGVNLTKGNFIAANFLLSFHLYELLEETAMQSDQKPNAEERIKQDWWKVYDLPHWGVLYRRIRESRGFKVADMTNTETEKRCGVHTTISRNLEKDGTAGVDTRDCYIAALQSTAADGPLTFQQGHILKEFYDYSQDREKIKEREYHLAAVNLVDIKQRRDELDKLLTELEQERRPAFIMDPLWFTHAINGALLYMFGIQPDSEYLYNWYAWHPLGTKFHTDSPVRNAHINRDEYLPPTLVQFFVAEHTRQFFFTWQMRSLLFRLHQLSEAHGTNFTDWWSRATKFDLPFDPPALRRTIRFQGDKNKLIKTQALPKQYREVKLGQGIEIPFSLMVWDLEHGDEGAREAFEEMRETEECRKIHYAADYDGNDDFHINNWPEVKTRLKDVLNSPPL